MSESALGMDYTLPDDDPAWAEKWDPRRANAFDAAQYAVRRLRLAGWCTRA